MSKKQKSDKSSDIKNRLRQIWKSSSFSFIVNRTERIFLLLLISPPGYGKTTLMEYVANRLGITFMKINGPAIGHEVTALDPNDAPNASAREEIDKLNMSLEMGDNVMIYLDDIGGQGENDPVSRVVGSLSQLESIISDLRAVPVNVEVKVLPVEERDPNEVPIEVETEIEQN